MHKTTIERKRCLGHHYIMLSEMGKQNKQAKKSFVFACMQVLAARHIGFGKFQKMVIFLF